MRYCLMTALVLSLSAFAGDIAYQYEDNVPAYARIVIDKCFNDWKHDAFIDTIHYTTGNQWVIRFGTTPNGVPAATTTGLIIFNSSVDWTQTSLLGYTLRSNALHEIGHLFGLTHSTNYPCVMGVANILEQIQKDDVDRIRSMYNIGPSEYEQFIAILGKMEVTWHFGTIPAKIARLDVAAICVKVKTVGFFFNGLTGEHIVD